MFVILKKKWRNGNITSEQNQNFSSQGKNIYEVSEQQCLIQNIFIQITLQQPALLTTVPSYGYIFLLNSRIFSYKLLGDYLTISFHFFFYFFLCPSIPSSTSSQQSPPCCLCPWVFSLFVISSSILPTPSPQPSPKLSAWPESVSTLLASSFCSLDYIYIEIWVRVYGFCLSLRPLTNCNLKDKQNLYFKTMGIFMLWWLINSPFLVILLSVLEIICNAEQATSALPLLISPLARAINISWQREVWL